MTNWSSNSPEETYKRERNAYRIANILLVTLVVFDIFSTINYLNQRGTLLLFAMILSYAATASIFICRWLIRKGRVSAAVWGLILTNLISLLLSPLLGSGLGLIYGVTAMVITAVIAGQGLKPSQIVAANLVGGIFGVATYMLDFLNLSGNSNSTNAGFTFIILFSLLMVAAFVVTRQFSSYTLRTKLIILFLIVSIIPLSLLTYINYLNSRAVLINNANEVLSGAASLTANQLDDYFTQNLNIIRSESQLPDLVDYLSLPGSFRSGSEEEIRAQKFVTAIARQESIYTLSISIIDSRGRVLVDTNSANTGKDRSNTDYFQAANGTGLPYTSSVLFDQETGVPSLYFSSPVRNAGGNIIGVLSKQYNASILQVSITENVGLAGTNSFPILLDNNHIRIADGSDQSLIYKTLIPLDIKVFTDLQSKQLLPSGSQEELSTNLQDFESKLNQIGEQPFFAAELHGDNSDIEQVTTANMTTQPWIVVFAQPQKVFIEPVNVQARNNILITILISLMIAGFGFAVSQVVAGPIIQLTRVAENISTGNYSEKANIGTSDEIGVLAQTFNIMTDQIQELIGNLEKRVEERTAELGNRTKELERTTVQSEKRARELQTITEISRHISTEKDLELLLPLITRTVSEQFGFYHVGVFLLNENKNIAVLRAANSPGGQRMLKRQHKLEVGQVGIVGNVTASGQPRIALDVGSDAIYFDNPDLPETRSEMALPLTTRGTIIGALDVQSTVSNAFTDSDISILSLLADQIAIAIDNVRLLEETRNALEETQSIFREYLAESWQKKAGTEIIGYHQTITGGQLITSNANGEINHPFDDGMGTLAVPIRLRDQVIGTLNVRSNKNDRNWNTDEVNIVRAVTERLGLALDNARLFEETSSRASRERLVSDITTKIRGTNDPQEMIQTAIAELQRALNVSRIEIVPRRITPPDK